MKKSDMNSSRKSSGGWIWRTSKVISVAMFLLVCWGCDSSDRNDEQRETPKAVSQTRPDPNVAATNDETAFHQAYEEALKRIHKALAEHDKKLPTSGQDPSSWFHGPSRWASMRFGPLVDEASALAKRVTDSDVLFLRKRLLRISSAVGVDHGPFFSVEARLAVLTLARSTPGDRAAKELGWLIKKNVPSAVYAMSLLPRNNSVPVLTEIAKQYRKSGHYVGHTVLQALVLLTIQGDKDSYKPLKAFDTDGRIQSGMLLNASFHDYVARFHKRLSMSESKGRESRRQEELIYWQCSFDRPPGRVIWVMMFQAAWRHKSNGVTYSTEFLRRRLPERHAIAIVGVQRERSLTSALETLAAKRNRKGEMAKKALKIMDDGAQTRPSSQDSNAM